MGFAHPYAWFAAHVDMGGFLRAGGASMALGFGNQGVEIRTKVGFARSAMMGPTVHIVLQGGGVALANPQWRQTHPTRPREVEPSDGLGA